MLYRALLVSQNSVTIIDRNRVLLTQLSPGLSPLLILSLGTGDMTLERALLGRCGGDWEDRSEYPLHTSGVDLLALTAIHMNPVISPSEVIPVQSAGGCQCCACPGFFYSSYSGSVQAGLELSLPVLQVWVLVWWGPPP